MVAVKPSPSAVLLEANRRLYELRRKVEADRASVVSPEKIVTAGHGSLGVDHATEPAPDDRTWLAHLPEHLGWECASVTAVLRTSPRQRTETASSAWMAELAPMSEGHAFQASSPETGNQQPHAQTVKLYPDIALGMLRKHLAAAGRIWLLLRYLDSEGRGWLRIDLIQEKLTGKDSELRVCGRRQLRNLLKQGRGIFWEQDEERLWLKSPARVAEALRVERLTGRPVALPVEALLGGIGQVKAHFYASFHSGRRSGNPISRAKLEQVTKVPERTQRVYEDVAGVNSQQNIAVGPRYSDEEVQEQAWYRGRGIFEFVDTKGRQGPIGRRYVAWQLPNSYEGCHTQCPKGRQKKINQQIDLVNTGAQGNGLDRSVSRQQADRLFHTNGLTAGRTYNRNGQDDVFWRTSLRRNVTKSPQLWQVIPGRRERSFGGWK